LPFPQIEFDLQIVAGFIVELCLRATMEHPCYYYFGLCVIDALNHEPLTDRLVNPVLRFKLRVAAYDLMAVVPTHPDDVAYKRDYLQLLHDQYFGDGTAVRLREYVEEVYGTTEDYLLRSTVVPSSPPRPMLPLLSRRLASESDDDVSIIDPPEVAIDDAVVNPSKLSTVDLVQELVSRGELFEAIRLAETDELVEVVKDRGVKLLLDARPQNLEAELRRVTDPYRPDIDTFYYKGKVEGVPHVSDKTWTPPGYLPEESVNTESEDPSEGSPEWEELVDEVAMAEAGDERIVDPPTTTPGYWEATRVVPVVVPVSILRRLAEAREMVPRKRAKVIIETRKRRIEEVE